jgi:hypothetical protein
MWGFGEAALKFSGEGRVELIVTLPEEMIDELRLAARERSCSPRQFAIETLEVAMASRRLPKVDAGRYGARPGQAHEETETVLIEHRILI